MSYKINKQVIKEIKKADLPVDDCLAVLLCIYYGITPTYVPRDIVGKVMELGVIDYNYEAQEYVWNAPLFEGQSVDKFEWINEFRHLFKAVNSDSVGDKAACVKRMKRFFSENPEVRKDDVLKATRRYLATVSAPMYCKKSHKFIYEGSGFRESSMLSEYLEISNGESRKGSRGLNTMI